MQERVVVFYRSSIDRRWNPDGSTAVLAGFDLEPYAETGREVPNLSCVAVPDRLYLVA
jgi:hypothetical protein